MISVVNLKAENNLTYFDQATQALTHKEYAAAKELYTKCLGNDAAVWFNLGVISVQENDYARAKLYFLRAERDWPATSSRTKLLDALTIVEQKLLGLPMNHESSWLSRAFLYSTSIFHSFSLFFFQLFFLVLLLMIAGYLGYRRFRAKKTSFRLIMGLFVLGMLCGILLISRYYAVARPAAVVIAQGLLYCGPGDYASIGELRLGDVIQVLEKEGKYVKIGTSLGSGWVEAPTIELI